MSPDLETASISPAASFNWGKDGATAASSAKAVTESEKSKQIHKSTAKKLFRLAGFIKRTSFSPKSQKIYVVSIPNSPNIYNRQLVLFRLFLPVKY